MAWRAAALHVGKVVESSEVLDAARAVDPQAGGAARRLHDRPLHDLHRIVAGSRGYGPLHAVPFQALHDGSRYLIERCEVVTSPSAALPTV